MPAFVSPKNRDHGKTEIGPDAGAMLGGSQGRRNLVAMMAKDEKQSAENNDDADFDEGGPILQVGAFASAPNVDGSDDSNHHDGDGRLSQGRKREHGGEVLTEDAGQSSYGAAGDDKKETPAVEKSGEAAKAVANVAIQAAGFGIGGGEFRISERAEQREDAANQPDQEGEADGAVHLAKDRARRAENAGANDRTDEEEKKIAEAESAYEFRHEELAQGGAIRPKAS